MSKEMLQAVEVLSNEKEIDRENVFFAVEQALATATKKRYDKDIGVQVNIDRETGEFETFQVWEVLDGDAENTFMDFPEKQLWLIDAVEIEPSIKPDEFIKEPMQSVSGRIAAQAVMQVIRQKIRESERDKVVEEYSPKIGQIVSGVVKRNDRGRLILDLGNNVEALVPREDTIPRDPTRPGDRVRGLLVAVDAENKGHMLILSRRSKDFLKELFKIEVPEIGEGVIDIMGVSRLPGIRAKISVHSNDTRLDPVGSCVGIRGARVQAVSNELAGERIDIVVWDENEAQHVINAFAPATIAKIFVDDDEHTMDIALTEEELPKAIGRGGQNIRLASDLTGWNLNAMSVEEYNKKSSAESGKIIQKFSEQLDVDEEVSGILMAEGYSTIEEVAYIPEEQMLEIEEFDEEMIKEIRTRAENYLVSKAILLEEKISVANPAEDLLTMEGMDERTAQILASNEITTMEDLADQSIDEIKDIKELKLSDEQISALIMTARQPWFAES